MAILGARRAKMPPVGITATVQGYAKFIAQVGTMNKAISTFGGIKAAGIGGLVNQAGMVAVKAQAASGGIEILTAAMVGLKAAAVIATAALAIVAVGIGGLFALSIRAAPLIGIAESFQRTANKAGILSRVLLTDMREASAGTISDFEMMRLANMALAGTTGEFAKIFGNTLPRLMEIARAQARATGQSVDYLFNSLVTGVKRAEPRLIDNTGIIIKIREANERYAESLGITVEQMNLFDRQMAVLNATMEAGQTAIENLALTQETAAEKMQRAHATITNFLDILGVSLQEGFSAILDVFNEVLGGIAGFVTASAPYIAAISRMFAQMLLPASSSIRSFAQELNSPENVQNFWVGGARIAGAIAGGLAQGAVEIIKVVTQIAKAIADFLHGFSPPPKGPLSTIDIGGRNVMLAWLQGFLSVPLESVKQVAQEISDFMGNIAHMGLAQVEARLKVLDDALKPFEDRLTIVKNLFESLIDPAKKAIEAVQRQIDKALVALARGDEGSSAVVRSLDMQREKLEQFLDTNQSVIDTYEIQLMLLKAQQEPERTLLMLQQARMQAILEAQKAASAAKAKKEPAGPKPKKEAEGEGEPPPREAPEGGGAVEEEFGVMDLLGLGEQDISEAMLLMQNAFEEGSGGWLGVLEESSVSLQEQLDRIGGVDIGGSISAKFKNFGQGLIDEMIRISTQAEEVGKKLFHAFADPIADLTMITLGGFGTFAEGLIDAGVQLFLNFSWIPGAIVMGLIKMKDMGSDAIKQLWNNFSWVPEAMINGLLRFLGWGLSTGGALLQGLADLFLKHFLNIGAGASLIFANLFDSGLPTSIPNLLLTLKTAVIPILDEFFGIFDDLLFNPVETGAMLMADVFRVFFIDDGEERSLMSIITRFLLFASSFPESLGLAWIQIGPVITATFVNPIIAGVNIVITAFQSLLRFVRDAIADFLELSVGPLLTVLGDNIPGFGFLGMTGRMLTSLGKSVRGIPINFGTVPFVDVQVPQAASGGLFSGGALQVGERGTEMITAASRIAVFPNEFVRAVSGLTSAMSNPVPHVSGGVVNNNVYHNDSSIHANFNGNMSPQGVMTRLALLRTF